MARRSRNDSYYSYYGYAERDLSTRSLPKVRPHVYLPAALPSLLSPLSLYEDRRSFHPLRSVRPAGVVSRRSQRRLIETSTPSTLTFASPRKVLVCVRRKTRRQVLHALNRTGRGARSKKHQNNFSRVSCR